MIYFLSQKIIEKDVKENKYFTYTCNASDPDTTKDLIYEIDWSKSTMQGNSRTILSVDSTIQVRKANTYSDANFQ